MGLIYHFVVPLPHLACAGEGLGICSLQSFNREFKIQK